MGDFNEVDCNPDTEGKQIPGFPEEYKITPDSSVWSRFAIGGRGQAAKLWRKMKQGKDKDGYRVVCLRTEGKTKKMRVHRLMLMAFVGVTTSAKNHGCHNDGDVSNNNIENLRWDTQSGNFSDRDLHGTSQRGEGNCRVKITQADVIEIYRLLVIGVTQIKISEQYGISRGQVSAIKRGVTWTHIWRKYVEIQLQLSRPERFVGKRRTWMVLSRRRGL